MSNTSDTSEPGGRPPLPPDKAGYIPEGEEACFANSKKTVRSPTPKALALILLLLVLLVGALKGWQLAMARFQQRRVDATMNEADADNELKEIQPKKPRLKSLDCFRGIAIVLMIFCNSGAGGYYALEHEPWNGLHMADLIFPSFLWIMGVCIPMSIKSQLARNTPRGKILQRIVKRSIKLFLIGLFLNSLRGPNMEDLRIFGVLQRFGVAYLVVTSVYVICIGSPVVIGQHGPWKQIFKDIISIWPQWCCMLALVAIHLFITILMPVPDCPAGYLGPGGIHEMGKYNSCIGGATGYIDRLILGENHLYQKPTAKRLYHSHAFDPEGLFGCLLTIVQVFLGVQCGQTLLQFPDWQARVKRWMAWATACGLLGGLLCGFTKETGLIPINKNMWSLSFVLVTTAVAFLLLTICFLLVDLKRVWTGFPFVYCGMNAMVLYIGHSIFSQMLPFHYKFGRMNTHTMLLIENIWNTLMWVWIAYYLYRRKIFYSV